MAKKLQKHLSKEHYKHRVIYHREYWKISSQRKWIERDYHVQDNADVAQKYLKMYCDTNQFPALPFCVPHQNTHGARGLIK